VIDRVGTLYLKSYLTPSEADMVANMPRFAPATCDKA
jgi:hypothetical protein